MKRPSSSSSRRRSNAVVGSSSALYLALVCAWPREGLGCGSRSRLAQWGGAAKSLLLLLRSNRRRIRERPPLIASPSPTNENRAISLARQWPRSPVRASEALPCGTSCSCSAKSCGDSSSSTSCSDASSKSSVAGRPVTSLRLRRTIPAQTRHRPGSRQCSRSVATRCGEMRFSSRRGFYTVMALV